MQQSKLHYNRMIFKNKKAAMEMSMGTIVTIVIVVVTLVLALVLIRTIFSSSTGAIDQVSTAIQDQINQLFTSGSSNLVIYPASRQITIKRGDTPKGFGFAVKNPGNSQSTFKYVIGAQSMHQCGSLTLTQADSFVIGDKGSFSLGPSAILDPYALVKFDVPKSTPTCTITYGLTANETSPHPENTYSTNIFVTIN